MVRQDIDRRTVLTGAVGAVASALIGHARGVKADWIGARNDVFAACRREPDGSHAAILFEGDGRELFSVALPARGHDCAVRPGTREVVTFARRPGDFAVAFGGTRSQAFVFSAPAGRHFYGHGVFSPDGRLLYATENEIETGDGRIGLYDATDDYRSITSFATHGIGPHDLALVDDGRTLIVANGGIRTDPRFGRQPLNLAEMRPSIAFFQTASGDLIAHMALPSALHQVSLRHLAIAPDGLVAVAAQYMGPSDDRPELVYTLRKEGELEALHLPARTLAGLRNYVTSIAIDRQGRRLAISSAKGNRVVIIDLAERRLAGENTLADAAGLAPAAHGFLVTDGGGGLTMFSLGSGTRILATTGNWDNHARRIA